MRGVAVAILVVTACGESADDNRRSFDFGPYTIQPGEEVTDQCVQISLANKDYVYVNSVELTTGPGFHHSNWFWVPDGTFAGEDGTFDCDAREFSEPIAALFGGVLFAQSTQAPHEIQAFPEGVAIRIPPQSKIVTQIHLLNGTDAPIEVRPNIKLALTPEPEVTTILAGISFQNQALALPPNRESRFSTECDLGPEHQALFGRDPDFKIFYALAHYHELGIGLSIDAIKPDGTTTNVYTTSTQVGDTLGGPVAPAFDMTGYTKLRMSCDFFNPRADTVRWGVGDQEMCVFLAFSDSEYNWGGGVNDRVEPENPMQVGDAMHFSNPCTVFANRTNN